MGKDSLEKFFMKLNKNLFEELLFYIPEHLIADELLIENNLLELKKYFQTVIYMDRMKGPVLLEESKSKLNMILRTSFLEKNIFILLKKKDKESKATFNFILEKYVNQIQGYCFVSKWMADNIETTVVKDLNTKAINSFKEQSECYRIHLADIKSHFQNEEIVVLRESTVSNDSIEEYIPKLMEQIQSLDEKIDMKTALLDSIVKEVTSEAVKSNPEKVAQKKKLLISQNEADEFILRTVFNLTLMKEEK